MKSSSGSEDVLLEVSLSKNGVNSKNVTYAPEFKESAELEMTWPSHLRLSGRHDDTDTRNGLGLEF